MKVSANSWGITEWVFWDFGRGHEKYFFDRRKMYHEF